MAARSGLQSHWIGLIGTLDLSPYSNPREIRILMCLHEGVLPVDLRSALTGGQDLDQAGYITQGGPCAGLFREIVRSVYYDIADTSFVVPSR